MVQRSRNVAHHETSVFLLLTFGIAWPLWFASGVLGRDDAVKDLHWWVAQIGVFAPALAALVVASWNDARVRARASRTLILVYLPATLLGHAVATNDTDTFPALGTARALAVVLLGVWLLVWFARRGNRLTPWPGAPATRATVARWTLGCMVAPTAAFLLAWWVSGADGEPTSIPAGVVRDLTAMSVLHGWCFNLVFGGSLGEELGWRGLWLPRLLRAHTPLAASLVIGVTWALWHAPIDLSAGFGSTGPAAILLRLVWTLPVTLLFTWVTLRAGGSLLPPLVFHTTINIFPDFAMRDPARYERTLGVFFLLTLAAAVIVALRDRRMAQARPHD